MLNKVDWPQASSCYHKGVQYVVCMAHGMCVWCVWCKGEGSATPTQGVLHCAVSECVEQTVFGVQLTVCNTSIVIDVREPGSEDLPVAGPE